MKQPISLERFKLEYEEIQSSSSAEQAWNYARRFIRKRIGGNHRGEKRSVQTRIQ